MTRHNAKLLGLMLALALLCAALFAGPALADGAGFTLSVRSAEGDPVDIIEDAVSGSFAYRVYIDLEDADSIDFTMATDEGGQPTEWETIPGDHLPTDEVGAFIGFNPYVDEGLTASETAYFRLPGDDDSLRKLILNYSICDTRAAITNQETDLRLMTPFTLNWSIEPVPAEGRDVGYEVV